MDCLIVVYRKHFSSHWTPGIKLHSLDQNFLRGKLLTFLTGSQQAMLKATSRDFRSLTLKKRESTRLHQKLQAMLSTGKSKEPSAKDRAHQILNEIPNDLVFEDEEQRCYLSKYMFRVARTLFTHPTHNSLSFNDFKIIYKEAEQKKWSIAKRRLLLILYASMETIESLTEYKDYKNYKINFDPCDWFEVLHRLQQYSRYPRTVRDEVATECRVFLDHWGEEMLREMKYIEHGAPRSRELLPLTLLDTFEKTVKRKNIDDYPIIVRMYDEFWHDFLQVPGEFEITDNPIHDMITILEQLETVDQEVWMDATVNFFDGELRRLLEQHNSIAYDPRNAINDL